MPNISFKGLFGKRVESSLEGIIAMFFNKVLTPSFYSSYYTLDNTRYI